MIQKRLHDINTFQCTTDNEVYLVGSDENGAEFTIVFVPGIPVIFALIK